MLVDPYNLKGKKMKQIQTWIDEDKCFNSTDAIEKYIVGLIKEKIKEWTKFVKDYKLSHTETKKENKCI